MAAVMGSIGTAQTLIAPRGIAYAAGEAWSARARTGDIHPGTPVRVVGVEGLELIVEPAGTGEASTTEENPSHA
jgi:membrane-bound ClpP family serine protease